MTELNSRLLIKHLNIAVNNVGIRVPRKLLLQPKFGRYKFVRSSRDGMWLFHVMGVCYKLLSHIRVRRQFVLNQTIAFWHFEGRPTIISRSSRCVTNQKPIFKTHLCIITQTSNNTFLLLCVTLRETMSFRPAVGFLELLPFSVSIRVYHSDSTWYNTLLYCRIGDAFGPSKIAFIILKLDLSWWRTKV